jgi:uncharacterized damage-inducible protein DinB
MRSIEKPEDGEFAPYAIMYIGLLPDDGRVLDHLRDNLATTTALIRSLPEEKLTWRYAERKWTVKDILLHIIDDERIYAYRALRFARNDKTELPGFEQDDYVAAHNANERSIDDLLEELATVRAATLTLFNSFDDAMLRRTGVANGAPMSVRAAAYHLAGHELHHVNIIRERYVTASSRA